MIFHALQPFEECESINEVIVVLPAAASAGFLSLVGKYGLRKVSRVVPGGATRADSVKRYLHDLGVQGNRVSASSRGELDATGTDDATWAVDRRVDVDLQ